MAIFGAQGIRDAMTRSYHKHVRELQGRQLPGGTSLHEAALYGALASRYIVSFQSAPEAVIWMELAPFTKLEPQQGLDALAEYVVYKEMPAKADTVMLAKSIRLGLSAWSDDALQGIMMGARLNNFPWASLV